MARLLLARDGWRWAVLAVERPGDAVSIVKLARDLAVSVARNTDNAVSAIVGHAQRGRGSAGRVALGGRVREGTGEIDVSNLISAGERD
jgi:hypothetical protein